MVSEAIDENRPMSNSSAIPTFLETDPYPDRTPDGRPTSAVSAATDGTSEFAFDDYTSARERQSTVPSTTGPVGEPGLPPSRPASVGVSEGSTQRGSATPRTSQAPPSRRGLPAFGRGSFRNSGEGSMGDPSRPNSSLSKTHVPSLTPQSFFRPMSSQKLQAQRGQRPGSSLAQNSMTAGPPVGSRPPRRSEDSTVTRHRYSNASVNTFREGLRTRDEDVPPLPVSRGTAFTSEGTTTGQQDGNGHIGAPSVVSNNSATPLKRQENHTPQHLKLDANGALNTNKELPGIPTPKSPLSLRASLGLNSRRASKQNDQERRPSPGHGHEKLHSDPSSPNDTTEKPPLPMPAKPSKPRKNGGAGKNYEYFAGNTLFFVSGRFMNIKARPLNVVTFFLTVLPCALFFGFSAPWLWHAVSPAIPIIFAYMFYITVSAFLHAAFSDPGILPRNLHPHPPNPEEERDPLTVGPPTTEWVMVKTFPSSSQKAAPGAGDVEAQQQQTTAMEVPTKYCKSCNIWRPLRAHHCRVCDACIETQDHHCVWLNNCVGRRNYRFFFSYVGFASLLAILLMAFSLTHVGMYASRHHISFGASLAGRPQERVAFAMFLYCVLALPYPGSLFIYHLFLIARGETTREYLNSHKFLPKDRHRPFTQASWWKNWNAVLTRPRPPTYMQFRHAYTEGDVRFGFVQPKRVRKAELKGRYSVSNGVGGGANTKKDGEKQGLEMKPLSPPSSQKETPQQQQQQPEAKPAGGLSGPVNRTPR